MLLFFSAIHLLASEAALAAAVTSAQKPTPVRMEPEEVQRAIWSKVELFSTDLHAVMRNGDGAPRFRLAYMPCRNRGEIPRLILEEARCPYELEVIGFQVWKQHMKPHVPYGKLPCLYDFDGLGNALGQEQAITRFLAQRVGLAGHGAAEQAKVDELYSFFFCTLRNNGLSHDGDHYSTAALKALAETREVGGSPRPAERLEYETIFRQNELPRAERSLAALGVFEAQLRVSGTGFLVGRSPTYADLALFHVLWELAEPDKVPDFAARFDLPELGAFLQRMEERPHLREYLRSPRRLPRYAREVGSGLSTYAYCEGRWSPRPEAR